MLNREPSPVFLTRLDGVPSDGEWRLVQDMLLQMGYSSDSRDAAFSALCELEEFGLVERREELTEDGSVNRRFWRRI